jgi:YD repeat-containing protein
LEASQNVELTVSLRFYNGISVLVVLAAHSAFAQGVIYSYDSAGHLMKANYGAAGTVTYTYDNAGRLIARVPATGGGAAWTISKTHISNFSAAQPIGFFTVTVSNTQGSAPTSGTVTVTEVPASNETLLGLAGANWNCSGNTCTRSDALAPGSSYPSITVTVSLAADSSTQVSNQVTVSGGGLAQASVTDVAAIIPALTDIPAGDSFFVPAIDLLRESGITSGCAVNAYCETDTVTQGQMAVFVVRSVMGGVPTTHIFFKWIQKDARPGNRGALFADAVLPGPGDDPRAHGNSDHSRPVRSPQPS